MEFENYHSFSRNICKHLHITFIYCIFHLQFAGEVEPSDDDDDYQTDLSDSDREDIDDDKENTNGRANEGSDDETSPVKIKRGKGVRKTTYTSSAEVGSLVIFGLLGLLGLSGLLGLLGRGTACFYVLL